MKIENMMNVPTSPVSKCPIMNMKLSNFVTGKQTRDTLHFQSKPLECKPSYCVGSLMGGQSLARTTLTPKPRPEVKMEAEKFLQEYYLSLKSSPAEDHQRRLAEVEAEIESTGSWTPSKEELHFGARTAWRNAARCIGRIQWNRLELQDCRHVTSTKEMYEALLEHLDYATNAGNIRSMITVFPQRMEGREDFRMWSPQMLSYAGYLQPDGSIIGDPAKLQLTRICQRLGWKGKGGRFDILPWVFSAPGETVKYYEIPEERVVRIPLEHPKYPWFAEMGLEWYAIPAVSDMMLDMGGIEFTACPFNGWYMGSEIGARDLCDPQRYNITDEVAEKLGLDMSTPITLWKDQVLVEVNVAVLHSFQKNRVTLVDHHTASEQFMKHYETEQKLRGGCPADWVWIVPPMSASLTPVYHQEMLSYILKPSYEYQEKAWKTYKWSTSSSNKLKYHLGSVAKAALCACSLMNLVRHKRRRCTVLFATETGKSETFAQRLAKLMHNAFNARVMCMTDYDLKELASEHLLLVVASTFGTGEAPDNGKDFWKDMQEIMKRNPISLEGIRFSVFALGSTQYPTFCAFGKDVDTALCNLGGERLLPVGLGDELRGQEQTFHQWAEDLYKMACTKYNVNVDFSSSIASFEEDDTWDPKNFRVIPVEGVEVPDLCTELSRLHHKKVAPCKVLSRARLQARHSDRQTILVRMDTRESPELTYEPGDHLGVFPANSPEVVKAIVQHLRAHGFKNGAVRVESLNSGKWKTVPRLPVCSIETALARYLDITSPPTSHILSVLADTATQNWDKYRLKRLAQVIDEYEEWRSYRYPNLAEVLEEFPSIRLTPAFILSQFPLLQARYYSISSSRQVTPSEVHLTMSLVTFNTQDGKGPLHQGVCTSYLNGFPQDDVPCFVKLAPTFRLPSDPQVPVIMIGSGSGLAPFRGFWQQREVEMRNQKCLREPVDLTESGDEEDEENERKEEDKSSFGRMVLFFGCRQSNVDNIFNHETTPLLRKGVLQKVITAFSRQPGKKKVYVQDAIIQERRIVYDLLVKRGGHMFVCGDAAMADGIRTAVKLLIGLEGSLPEKEVDGVFQQILSDGRYHEDVFGILHRRDNKEMSWRKGKPTLGLNEAVSVKARRKSTSDVKTHRRSIQVRHYRPSVV